MWPRVVLLPGKTATSAGLALRRKPAEVDALGGHGPGGAPRRGRVLPVEVGVGDDLVRRRRAPLRAVAGRVRVADENGVVAADQRPVERGADAGVALGASDDQASDAEVGKHRLQVGVLEGVAVALRDDRLVLVRVQLGDDPPDVAPADQVSSACWTQTTGA